MASVLFYLFFFAHWHYKTTCNIAKLNWKFMGKKKTGSFLFLNYRTIHRTAAVLTGHYSFVGHAESFGIPSNGFYRSCGEEEETVFFFLAEVKQSSKDTVALQQ